MPIQSFSDYIPVMDQFIIHWTATDAALKLPFGEDYVGLTDFEEIRANLDVAKSALQARLNDLDNNRVALEQIRNQCGDRVAEFNRRIRADFPKNRLFNRLPAVPNRTAGREAFISALDDVLDLWGRVNAQPSTPVFTSPLLLLGGFDIAECAALRAEVDAGFSARGAAERETSAARILRNTLQDEAMGLMKQYRLRIEGLHAPDSLAVKMLPKLTPAPGHTPEPVLLSGTWNMAQSRADLTWTASSDPELDRYEVRSTPGLNYSAEDESIIATIPPAGPLVFSSAEGYALPGNAVSYKVYVRLNTGNQAGSEAVTILRPG
jgi:hypothetical protein